MSPPSTAQRAADPGIQWAWMQVYNPVVPLPMHPYISLFPRWRAIDNIVNAAVGTEVVANINIDIPFMVYGLVGSAALTDGAALPGNLHPLDTFRVGVRHTQGDLLVTGTPIARCVLGTAERPMLVGGSGWNFDQGSVLQFLVTPLVANLTISIVAMGIEKRGPQNYTPGSY